jgi:undecaprenyl-diphosphatase
MLATLFAIGGSLWAFVALAGEVLEGDSHTFDRVVLLALRNPLDPAVPLGPRWLEQVARDVTSLGSVAVLVLLSVVVAGYLLLIHRRALAAFIVVSIGGGSLLSALLKGAFGIARPDLVPHAVEAYTTSFPSGHAMLSTVTYLTLAALLAGAQEQPRVKVYLIVVAIALAVLVGVSRIYLGVHWSTDVLAGWCVGSAWAMLCWLVARKLQFTQ